MKVITAYECDFCKVVYKSKSGISKHEKICFKNPLSKSCITCENLGLAFMLNGKVVSEREERIAMFMEPGTYHDVTIDEDGSKAHVLNEEFAYLYEANQETYCHGLKCKLDKLRTNCNTHQKLSV